MVIAYASFISNCKWLCVFFQCSPADSSHLAMTYSALCCLLILGDSLASLNCQPLAQCVARLQQDCGSFSPASISSQTDMKFSYCAVAICHILQQVKAINGENLIEYIKASLVSCDGNGWVLIKFKSNLKLTCLIHFGLLGDCNGRRCSVWINCENFWWLIQIFYFQEDLSHLTAMFLL